jgi:Xaa-Pro aminopeptidase
MQRRVKSKSRAKAAPSKNDVALGRRYAAINPQLFVNNREHLRKMMLPRALAVVNANDVLPTNADGAIRLIANSDLFYLTGI